MQPRKVWGDNLFVAGGGDEGVEVHGSRDLRPSGNLRALELRTGRWITGHDLGAQLVHHLGCKPWNGRMLPSAALLLEFLAERRYGCSVAARRPLRDHGQARLHSLGAGETRGGKEAGGAREYSAAAKMIHWFVPFVLTERVIEEAGALCPPSSICGAVTSLSGPAVWAALNVGQLDAGVGMPQFFRFANSSVGDH